MTSPGGASDRRGTGIGAQRPGIGEPGPVVADFSEYTGAGELTQPRKTGDNPAIGMLAEGGGSGFAELIGTVAHRIQHGQQRECLLAQCLLHQRWLAQLGLAQDAVQSVDNRLDIALPTTAP